MGLIITDIDSQDAPRPSSTATCPTARCRRSCCAAGGRPATGSTSTARTSAATTCTSTLGGQYDAFRYRLYTDWLTQNRLFNGRTPVFGAGSGDLRDLPAAHLAATELGRHRVRPPRHRRLLRVAATRPGTSGWTATTSSATDQDRLLVERDQPRQRLYRPDHSGRLPTTNASAEFGYSTPQYHFAVNYLSARSTAGSRR